MRQVIPMSEDFFYWDPEAICDYPDAPGVEDHWFFEEEDKEHVSGNIFKMPNSKEVKYAC